MDDTLGKAMSIYDGLNTFKLISFHLSDSDLQLAMDNLEHISSLQ
jgi:hypothetical protein